MPWLADSQANAGLDVPAVTAWAAAAVLATVCLVHDGQAVIGLWARCDGNGDQADLERHPDR